MMLNIGSAHFRLWVVTFTQERAPRKTFIFLKSTIETLKKCEICLKLRIKTPSRLSTVFIVNFGHIFLVFLQMALNK